LQLYIESWVQWTSENWTVQISNGHLSDTNLCPDFECIRNPDRTFLAACLDRFVMNKIFLWPSIINRSRLVDHSKSGHDVWIQMVRYSNARDWHEIESDKTGQSGFQMLTLYSVGYQNQDLWILKLNCRNRTIRPLAFRFGNQTIYSVTGLIVITKFCDVWSPKQMTLHMTVISRTFKLLLPT
jgi:hypothetical protein